MGKSMIRVLGNLHRLFGVEVGGLQLHRHDQSDVDSIRKLLAEHGLLLLREQTPSDLDLREFAQHLGTGELELSARSVTHSAGVPEVSNLTNLLDSDGGPLGYGGDDEDYWHSDQEFRLRPATLAMLYCLIPAPHGGNTTFAPTSLDALNLDAQVIGELERSSFARRPAPSNDHDNTPQVVVSHPALLSHPSGTRRSAYVTEHSHRYLADGTLTKSDPLLKQVLAAILSEENRYSHEWRSGDLLLFDNTQLIHRREAFSGIRFLKSLKVFAPGEIFCVPGGEILRDVTEAD